MCLNCWTPKTINFPFVTNGKFIILGVRILMHITVIDQYGQCGKNYALIDQANRLVFRAVDKWEF